jgi:hypothetical protein
MQFVDAPPHARQVMRDYLTHRQLSTEVPVTSS